MTRAKMFGSPRWFIVFRLLIISSLAYGGYELYQKYEIRTLPAEETGMTPTISPQGMVLVDLFPSSYSVQDVVIFTLPVSDEEKTKNPDAQRLLNENSKSFHVARIVAVPGDQLAMGNAGLTINQNPIVPPEATPRRIYLIIPKNVTDKGHCSEDEFLLFSDNPDAIRPDSQTLGFIPRECIVGKVVRNWPW